ncbi:MAG TPA: response regulator [Puia sp.]|nr:response regulator [Puia sp.]
MDYPLKILHLEDLVADAEIVERILRKAQFHFEKKVVSDEPEYIQALKEFKPDIILSDHSLPAFNSLEALRLARETGITAPFILITATVSEEFAVSVIKEGASDYILKDRLERLPNAIKSALDKYRTEKELARQADLQQKLITETSIQVQEREREEIGRELHDNINQILAATKLYLDTAIQTEATMELLLKSHENLSLAIEEIRQLSQSLVAPSLKGITLSQALSQLINNMPPSTSLELNLDTANYKEDIDDENLKLTCYRIVQVQVNNIIRHARAKKATIQLKRTPEQLEMIIQDDGVGFDTKKKTSGIGIRNIRNRVGFYNGTITILSAPGQGCTLTVTVPLLTSPR